MNYELAQKLKDAGFPQNINLGTRYYDEADLLDDPSLGSLLNTMPLGNQEVEGWLKVPTLEELIEACGGVFHFLKLGTKQTGENEISDWWYATASVDKGELVPICDGPTPLEAMVNLYCELKKNGTL